MGLITPPATVNSSDRSQLIIPGRTGAGAPADGKLLGWVGSAAAGGPAWVPAPSGGGAGGGVLLLESGAAVPAGTPVGTIIFEKLGAGYSAAVYDFTTGALPAGWGRHGTPTETFSGAGMAASMSSGQGYHVNPATLAPNFTLDLYLAAVSNFAAMLGPHATDNAGTGAGTAWYNSPNGALVINLTSYAYGSSFYNSAGTPAAPGVLRLARTGTQWQSAFSFDDGASWSGYSAALSVAGTPTRLGFGPALGTTTATITKAVYTPTGGSGGARGWWDGSTIQPLK